MAMKDFDRDWLQKLARQRHTRPRLIGDLSRRQILKSAAAGTGLFLGASLIPGCGSSDGGTLRPGTQTKALGSQVDPTPIPGGFAPGLHVYGLNASDEPITVNNFN